MTVAPRLSTPEAPPTGGAPAIVTRSLRKVYPPPRAPGRPAKPAKPTAPATPAAPARPGIVALEGLDLEVRDGEFFGVLGPNGAGKTTALGILTTRVVATSGEARVSGHDVSREPVAVKRRIGVVPQRPNPDRSLLVRENLLFHAAYFGVPAALARDRARDLLERFDLASRAESKMDQLSGGQQQRLMIARALIHDPRILFLDEPTVGLDPQARLALWDILRELHAQGRTVVMTTHYMEEADRLCERVAIIDHGKLLALDSPAALKARAPDGTLIELTLDGEAASTLESARAVPNVLRAEAHGNVLRVHAPRAGELVGALFRALEPAGRGVVNMHLSPPSLETLFVSMTGRKLD